MIGRALYGAFSKGNYDVVGADKVAVSNDFFLLDITQRDIVQRTVSRVKPDVVVLSAALSGVDKCEELPLESERVNLGGLQNVIDAVDKEKTVVIYFSSDYIFDGANGPYTESDKPNPLCVYGKHKLMGEEMIKKALKKHLIVRSTGVFGPEIEGKNFVLSLMRKLKNGERVKVPFDQIGSPTYSENLAEVIEELVRKGKTGVYNIVGPELTDRYSFAREVCKVFELSENMLVPVTTQELDQKAKRPLKGGLKIDKVKKDILTRLVGYKEGLRLLKNHYE